MRLIAHHKEVSSFCCAAGIATRSAGAPRLARRRPVSDQWDPRCTHRCQIRATSRRHMRVLARPKRIPIMSSFGLEVVEYLSRHTSCGKADDKCVPSLAAGAARRDRSGPLQRGAVRQSYACDKAIWWSWGLAAGHRLVSVPARSRSARPQLSPRAAPGRPALRRLVALGCVVRVEISLRDRRHDGARGILDVQLDTFIPFRQRRATTEMTRSHRRATIRARKGSPCSRGDGQHPDMRSPDEALAARALARDRDAGIFQLLSRR